ncbi:hypothetical protein ACFX1Q_004523 [Malus domestica]
MRLKRWHAEKVREQYDAFMKEYLREAEYGKGSRRRPCVTHFTGCQPCSGAHHFPSSSIPYLSPLSPSHPTTLTSWRESSATLPTSASTTSRAPSAPHGYALFFKELMSREEDVEDQVWRRANDPRLFSTNNFHGR